MGCKQEVHNKIREQFRNMPDEFMTSSVAATSKVSVICPFNCAGNLHTYNHVFRTANSDFYPYDTARHMSCFVISHLSIFERHWHHCHHKPRYAPKI